ncbi:MAG: UDP-2,4-diacetamido-2,4,6-trideoxy-beta-L-altropyranose hydrolase [Sulfuriferula sp.]
MAAQNIAFRVDASSQIGTGHFMRCLTLADALKQRGVQIRFVSRHMPEHLRDMLVVNGHEFMLLDSSPSDAISDGLSHAHWLGTSQHADAQDTAQALSDHTWDWLVVDHYALDFRWESELRQTAKNILAIDDIADRQHDCDALLDQNFYADMDTRYIDKVPSHSKLLLGPRYALLRDEFRQLREQVKPRSGPAKRVLVFFGGVDADNYTGRAIEAVANINIPDLRVDVVIGVQHPSREEIEGACVKHGFNLHVQTARMAELMVATDLAIGAGGAVTWERCCLGVPALVFVVAENQRRLVEDAAIQGFLYAPLSRSGTTSSVELHLKAFLDNPALLQLVSRRGLDAVDGRGVYRVLRAIGCGSIVIREATQADSENLFLWRNHPSIRAVSRNTNPIEKPDHQAWLGAILSSPDSLLLIGECQGEAIGVVRFDVRADEAEVSIYLVPGRQAQGFGSELLLAAEQWLTKYRADVLFIKAEVLGNNEPSQRLFHTAGYQTHATLYTKKVHRL